MVIQHKQWVLLHMELGSTHIILYATSFRFWDFRIVFDRNEEKYINFIFMNYILINCYYSLCLTSWSSAAVTALEGCRCFYTGDLPVRYCYRNVGLTCSQSYYSACSEDTWGSQALCSPLGIGSYIPWHDEVHVSKSRNKIDSSSL